jgi:hypothetical protein
MKSLLFISACGLALSALSACAPVTPATARVALDCPTDAGDLKLSNVAADKKTCLYTTGEEDQVSLRLIPVSGSYEQTLQPIEQELRSEIETAQPAADGKAADAGGRAAPASATATSASKSAAAKAADEAAQDARAIVHGGKKDADDEDDNDKTDSGDRHDDSGDHAHIDLPGIHINADDDKADVNVGGINVNAGENGATVRVTRDVRLRGEAFKPERRGFRSTFILARDDLKDGWKSVGYEAAGPKVGPITVAVFKAHEGRHHDVSEDVKRLVRHNGGV